MPKVFYFLLILTIIPWLAFAKTDLSLSVTDITFSKENALEGEKVRIYARVFNLGDADVYGFVVFQKDNKEIAGPQPISVKSNTYDDIFIDWLAEAGTFDIQAKIIGTNLTDENPENDQAIRQDYFVDLDTDGDGIGNKQDTDDDNDGLSDEAEMAMATNPSNPDSDGDKALDGIDLFPLNPREWQDSDKDGLGNNADQDNDNDGLNDKEEVFVFGTNPLNPDSDNDGLSDKEEIDLSTNPLAADSDKDGVVDSKDKFPLDNARVQASLQEAIRLFAKEKGIPLSYLIGGAVLVLLFVFLFFRRKR